MKTIRIYGPNNVWTRKVDDSVIDRIIFAFHAGEKFDISTEEGDPWNAAPIVMHFNPALIVCIEVTD